MGLFIDIAVMAVGFLVLIKGADLLVGGGAALAKRFDVSELVIGLTIVSFGTSAPELVVNTLSALRDEHELVFGNIIGSNIFNTLLVLGTAGMIRPLPVQPSTRWRELPLSLVGLVVLLLLINDSYFFGTPNVLERADGILLLVLFGFFLLHTYRLARRGRLEVDDGLAVGLSLPRAVLLLAVGLIALPLGAHLVIDHAVSLAVALGASRKLIGLTLVAAGTSLPELAATAVAARRGNTDMAVSNVVGSNIFNILLILGATSCIRPVSYQSVLNIDALILMAATFLVLAFIFFGRSRTITRAQSATLLVLFASYMIFLVLRERPLAIRPGHDAITPF